MVGFATPKVELGLCTSGQTKNVERIGPIAAEVKVFFLVDLVLLVGTTTMWAVASSI